MDWSKTSLGPVAGWPQSPRTTVSICLASDLPICVIWGPGLVQLYNDAYRVICGDKHPRSMGQRARNDGEAIEQSRAMMERQVGRMVRLIDDPLDLSRLSRGKLELKRERIELSMVVRNAAETSRPLIEQMGHDLCLAVQPEPIYIDGDMTRLAQVVSHRLNNAARYTERCGRIRLCAERQGDDALVTVEDNGVGIPGPHAAESLPHVHAG